MLHEALPEKDWTPWQRAQMRCWDKLGIRDGHWELIELWKMQQLWRHDWVCLADLADWCARRPGDIERDPLRLIQAYADLQQSIVFCEFSKGGRIKIVCLPPQPPSLQYPVRLRLDAQLFRAQSGRVLDHILELCWAPRELCLRWLLGRQIIPPPWMADSIRVERAQVDEARRPPPPARATMPSPASEDRIDAALDAIYAAESAKPPNLKQVVRLVKAELATTNQIATWKAIEYCAKAPRHAVKRRPRGRTLKSEQTQP
jgi:hypothetical protein